MKPTITILDYLWSARNTWLKHHEECSCSFSHLSSEYVENCLTVEQWSEVVVVNDMPSLQMLRKTDEDWSELCGPVAQNRQLQGLIDYHMDEVSKIMTIQATQERQSSE